MKKIICLFLSIIMLISLCSCFGGAGDDNNVRGDLIDANTVPDNTTNAPEDEAEFSTGKTTENTYKNDFTGMSCTLPEDWAFYSDKQILELNNISAEYMDENTLKQLENATVVYDMFATNQTDGSSLNVNLEKINSIQIIGLDIKKTLESQIDALKSSFANMGATGCEIEYTKITVDGKEYDGLNMVIDLPSARLYEKLFAFRKGNYLVYVNACTGTEESISNVLSYITLD